MNLRVHTRNETRSSEKMAFMDSFTTSTVSVSRIPKDITGLGVHATWKSVLLSPNRGCENTFCCWTPGLLDVLHVLLPLLPSIKSTFFCKTFSILNVQNWKRFFIKKSLSQYKWTKEKEVNLLFQKGGKRPHFSGVRSACHSAVLH
jgi:hypothetical protein